MTVLPFRSTGDLILIPARLRGKTGIDILALLVLDTGATSSFVSWDVAVKLGYDPAAVPDRVRITTVSGIEYAPRITVARVSAIGVERTLFPVLCHTPPPTTTVDGVLGLDFFSGLRLTIDFRAGLLSVD